MKAQTVFAAVAVFSAFQALVYSRHHLSLNLSDFSTTADRTVLSPAAKILSQSERNAYNTKVSANLRSAEKKHFMIQYAHS